MTKYGWFLAGSVLASAFAQVLLKAGVTRATPVLFTEIPWLATSLSLLSSPLLIAGLLVYCLAAALWIGALSGFPLSFAYPFVAFGFLLTMLASALLLGESLSAPRIVGTMMIAAGACLVARG